MKEKRKVLQHKWWIWFGGGALLLLLALFLLYYFLFLPHIYLNGSKKETILYPNTYEEQGAYLKNVFGKIEGDITIDGTVNSSKIGNYTITYSYRQGLFHRKVERIVSITDNEAPQLILNGELKQTVCPNKQYVEEGYTATDNYDGDITNSVQVKTQGPNMIYEVEDSSSNKTTAIREITYADTEEPTITLKGSTTTYVLEGATYQEPGYTATDNCDGDITSTVTTSGEVNTNRVGTYTLTYEVTDSSGKMATVKRNVKVISQNESGAGKGVIYLTFDDGPHATYTAQILDILKKYNVKATFFVTKAGPDSLIKRAYDEGHTIGLHTWTHQYQTVYKSVESYFQDLVQISDRVKRITGEESKIIRFPGGSSNTISKKYQVGIMTILTNEVLNRGYHYFDWNISAGDAGETTDPQVVYRNITKNLSKNRSNVVLCHDIKSWTASALESVIQYGLANGYTFQKITMETPMVRQHVNN